jgi:hypothetical protein
MKPNGVTSRQLVDSIGQTARTAKGGTAGSVPADPPSSPTRGDVIDSSKTAAGRSTPKPLVPATGLCNGRDDGKRGWNPGPKHRTITLRRGASEHLAGAGGGQAQSRRHRLRLALLECPGQTVAELRERLPGDDGIHRYITQNLAALKKQGDVERVGHRWFLTQELLKFGGPSAVVVTGDGDTLRILGHYMTRDQAQRLVQRINDALGVANV